MPFKACPPLQFTGAQKPRATCCAQRIHGQVPNDAWISSRQSCLSCTAQCSAGRCSAEELRAQWAADGGCSRSTCKHGHLRLRRTLPAWHHDYSRARSRAMCSSRQRDIHKYQLPAGCRLTWCCLPADCKLGAACGLREWLSACLLVARQRPIGAYMAHHLCSRAPRGLSPAWCKQSMLQSMLPPGEVNGHRLLPLLPPRH
jgi:hypothetical protein